MSRRRRFLGHPGSGTRPSATPPGQFLYLLRRQDGTVDVRNATLVLADGAPRFLTPQQWSLEALDWWSSPQTGAVYPSRWMLTLSEENLRLEISPLPANQENRSRFRGGVFYWEGAVVAKDERGRLVGRGYVELTGYGRDNKPPV